MAIPTLTRCIVELLRQWSSESSQRTIKVVLLVNCLVSTQTYPEPLPVPQPRPWVHVSYGCANIKMAPDGPPPPAEPSIQTLINTFVGVVEKHGPRVIFYVNDLHPEPTQQTAKSLLNFAKLDPLKYGQVEIRELPGNYFHMNWPDADSADLSNPPGTFFELADKIDESLQRIADHTLEFVLSTSETKSMDTLVASVSTITKLGPGDPYIDPHGLHTHKPTARYLIAPRDPKKIHPGKSSEGILVPGSPVCNFQDFRSAGH